MSKLGSILLGVVAGTAAGIGVVLLLDKEKTLCKKNSISDNLAVLLEICEINQWS